MPLGRARRSMHSRAGRRTRVDLAETFALHADGRTKVIRETRPLDDVNDAFADVLAGDVQACLVFDLAAERATTASGEAAVTTV
jgi:D-arabinose 1-dehydrogenase-like Zn-dependent alcohol dehydrogenase